MAAQINTGSVHHVKLTVTDVARSVDFYTQLLGFQVVANLGTTTLMSNGSVILAVGTAPEPERALANDRFDENRVGLDHLSLAVASRVVLDEALRTLDERGVPHGEINDLGEGLGICVLAFRDPDNIQLELTSPRA